MEPGSPPDPDDSADPGRLRRTFAVIALLAALLASSLWLVGKMRSAARLQDCVAAGRTNCAPLP